MWFQKETCDEEHIDVISCEDSKDPTPSSLAQSPNASKSEAKRDSITCSECLEPYTNCCPITSMQCWHVHCEKCWFKAMVSTLLRNLVHSNPSPIHMHLIYWYSSPPLTGNQEVMSAVRCSDITLRPQKNLYLSCQVAWSPYLSTMNHRIHLISAKSRGPKVWELEKSQTDWTDACDNLWWSSSRPTWYFVDLIDFVDPVLIVMLCITSVYIYAHDVICL